MSTGDARLEIEQLLFPISLLLSCVQCSPYLPLSNHVFHPLSDIGSGVREICSLARIGISIEASRTVVDGIPSTKSASLVRTSVALTLVVI